MLSPSPVLNLSLGAHHCLTPSLGAHRHPLPQSVKLDPTSLEVRIVVLFLTPSTSTPPPSERIIAILFLPPSTSTLPPSKHASAVDLDPVSLGIKP
jgi:hypothetical protein